MLRLIKIFFIFLVIVVCVLFVLCGTNFHLFYWFVLIGWIVLVWWLKKDSKFSLTCALCIFLFCSLIASIDIVELAETGMRFGFVFWIVGLTQAFIDVLKNG
ncbi:hypothetical protein KKB40_06065 [Patescibacteria group bacterium]|nr:hypothetical protein [Patescibacteria group bacterium]